MYLSYGMAFDRAEMEVITATGLSDAGAKAIGVIALVTQQLVEWEAADQILGLKNVVYLTSGHNEADRVAERIDAGVVELGARPSRARAQQRVRFMVHDAADSAHKQTCSIISL